jgi:hypothetical protein
LKGELGSEAPTQMDRMAMKPRSAGRRRKDQSSGSPLGLDPLGEGDAAGEPEADGIARIDKRRSAR